MKCLSELSKGSRIAQYILRSRSNQSGEARRQDNPHSHQGISTSDETQLRIDPLPVSSPEPSQPPPTLDSSLEHSQLQSIPTSSPEPSQPHSTTVYNIEPSQLLPATERKMEGRKPQIMWPKYNQKSEWETIDSDLVLLLEQQKGPVERKLESKGAIIYS